MSDVNITSHGQQGGITANTVTVNNGGPPPLPEPPQPWWKSTWAWISGAVIVIAACVEILKYFGIAPWEHHMSDKDTINVTSYNQQGGITAHTVTIGSQPRSLANPNATELKEQILKELPRDKPITVLCLMGDAEGFRFAAEIHAFLKANGFKLTENGISQGVFNPPPKGLAINDKGDHVDFIVGSGQ